MKRIISTILIVIILVGVWNPSSGMQKTTVDDWWDPGWEYRKEITINHDMIDADLTNFPILFQNTSSDFIEHAQSDGDDFVFVDKNDETVYNHEIEYYDNTTGELIAWVNITNLSGTEDTILCLYYGNANCSSQQNPEDVWDSDYFLVYHCNSTENWEYDSTSNNNDANKTFDGDAPSQTTGKAGYGLDFDNNDDNMNSTLLLDAPITQFNWTVELWINMDETSQCAVWQQKDYPLDGVGRTVLEPDGTRWDTYYGGQFQNTENTWSAIDTSSWHYITLRSNYSTENITFSDNSNFFNWEQVNWATKNDEQSQGTFIWGTYKAGSGGDVDAQYDEIRFSTMMRSNSWINTNYNTINSPTTFLSVGREQNKEDDFTPPIVQITQPEFGFIYVNLFDAQLIIPILIPYATIIIGKINITVEAEDNVGIKWVKIYIDNVERANISKPPYIWLWDEKTIIFPYTLKVKACDYSGNENSDEIKVWKMQLFF